MSESKQNNEKDTVKLYAKVLGLSPEGMRFLEKKEIIFPEKKAKSGYRVYGLTDSYAVINYKKLRRYGFNMVQIQRLMKEPSNGVIKDELMRRHAILQDEIIMKQKTLRSIEKRLKQYELESSSTEDFFVINRPAFYWMETRKDMVLDESEAAVRTMENWNRNLSAYGDPAIIWSAQKLNGQGGHYYCGQVIEIEDAANEYLGDVHFSSATKCLCCIQAYEESPELAATIFDSILSFMKSKSIKPTGDGIARQIRMFLNTGNKYQQIWQLMVPFEKSAQLFPEVID